MKKFFLVINVFTAGLILASCSDIRRSPGTVYMPDMSYSRAYETYAPLDSAKFTNDTAQLGEGKIYYISRPVSGTIARGDEFPFPIEKDKAGDTVNYFASKQVMSPLTDLNADEMTEAERLYLVNCGICHGSKLDGNGPLYKDGNGPYSAAPKNLIADAIVSKMPEGQMFYSVTYGKNAMGSYASQLTTKQRWMVIRYIKTKQSATAAASAPKTDTAAKTK